MDPWIANALPTTQKSILTIPVSWELGFGSKIKSFGSSGTVDRAMVY